MGHQGSARFTSDAVIYHKGSVNTTYGNVALIIYVPTTEYRTGDPVRDDEVGRCRRPQRVVGKAHSRPSIYSNGFSRGAGEAGVITLLELVVRDVPLRTDAASCP